MVKGLELPVPHPDLQRWERVWRLTQSPLANGLIKYAYVMKPHKTPKGLGLESFWVGKHVEIRGRRCTWRGHGGSVPFPMPCPVHLFHLAVPELYSFIISW